jgi:hypothetical protein
MDQAPALSAVEHLAAIYAKRRENLIDLACEVQTNVELAMSIGVSKSLITFYISGKKPINEVRARKIEAHMGLEFGTLDR